MEPAACIVCFALICCTVQLLIREHEYWSSAPKLVRVRAANDSAGRVFNLSRYHAEWDLPRPESYK